MDVTQKIAKVKEGLEETFLLTVDSNKGWDQSTGSFKFYSRTLENDFCERHGVPPSQLTGILEALKQDHYILDYKEGYVLEDASVSIPKILHTYFDIFFPLDFKDLEQKHKIFAQIRFNTDQRKVILNESTIAQPNFNSPAYLFIDYIVKHPNESVSIEKLQKEIGQDFHSANNILPSLGFKGALRELFFPGVSVNGVYFKNPIMLSDLSNLNISVKKFNNDLKSVERNEK